MNDDHDPTGAGTDAGARPVLQPWGPAVGTLDDGVPDTERLAAPAAPPTPASPPPAPPLGPAGDTLLPGAVEVAAPTRGRGWRAGFAGGLVGALVGALVAGGLVVAFDDDPSSTTAVVREVSADDDRAAVPVVTNPGDIRSILDAVQPAVVRIDVNGAQGTGTGTGFVVRSDGVIVTNAHVVAGADQVDVTLDDGDVVSGDVLGAEPDYDLAVVKVERDDLPTVVIGDSDALQVGDLVVAIGSALGLEGGSGPSVTSGIVSGLDRTIDTEIGSRLFNLIQTDTAINPGNSGGPLVNANGEVVGINTAIANPGASNNVGFVIAISSARPIIDALAEGRTPRVAFLGVQTETVTPATAGRRDLPVDAGAYVVDLTPGAPAADAGIEVGDVIVEVDGSEITRSEEVARAVRRNEAGDAIEVTVVHDNGDRETLEVELATRPPGA